MTKTKVQNTKRGVLNTLLMIFGSLGMVSPFVVRAELLAQHLWKLRHDWDQLLSEAMLTTWESWLQELPLLENIEIPRCYNVKISQDAEVVHR